MQGRVDWVVVISQDSWNARQCGDIFQVWWKFLYKFCCKFHPISSSVKNVENRLTFGKVIAKKHRVQFLRHGIVKETQWATVNNTADDTCAYTTLYVINKLCLLVKADS